MYRPFKKLRLRMVEMDYNQKDLAMAAGILGCGILQAVFSGKKTSLLAEKWKGSVPEFLWCTLILFASILLLANNTYNPFIYFRF